MCHRMAPMLFAELQDAIRALRETGRATVPHRAPGIVVPDAYPGSQLPLFVPDDKGDLQVATLTWGLPTQVQGRSRLVFNTRIETALAQARSGSGLWAGPIARGRCVVPVHAFWERWTQPDPNGDPSQPKRQVRYQLRGHGVFLMACVREGDRFSVVTTRPNADVSPVHDRMPLVLAPGESRVWLGPDFATLADRRNIALDHQA